MRKRDTKTGAGGGVGAEVRKEESRKEKDGEEEVVFTGWETRLRCLETPVGFILSIAQV